MKTKSLLIIFLIPFTLFSQDYLNFRWESSVYYGTYGQRTVTADSMLVHVSGRSYGYTANNDEGDNAFSYVETFKESDGYWNVKEQRLLSRNYVNAEYYEGKIYIFGGASSGIGIRNEVEIYDLATDEISMGEPMPTPRRAAGSAIFDGKIYIVGGSDYTPQYFSSLDIYDIATDSWSSGADLPIAMETEMTKYGDKLYVLGGYNDEVQDAVYEYDISGNIWTLIGTMPEPTSAHKLAAFNGKIIVIGDYNDLERVQIYDIAANTWAVPNTNLFGRRHASIAILNDRLYYIAGNSKRDDYLQNFRIVQSIDLNDIPTAVQSGDGAEINDFNLKQNFPNPFNPNTIISFTLPARDLLTLNIFNAVGEKVKTLISKVLDAGYHEYNFDASSLASGVYFYELKFGNKWSQTKKMTLLK